MVNCPTFGYTQVESYKLNQMIFLYFWYLFVCTELLEELAGATELEICVCM